MVGRHLVGAASCLAVLSATVGASAVGPVDIEVAGIGGYGTNALTGTFGGRAGVSVYGFYVGFRAQYYVGETVASGLGSPLHYHQLAVGGEFGWGWRFAFVTLRPLLGIGDAMTSCGFVSPTGAPSGTCGQLYLNPGGLVQFQLGHLLFGVEATAFSPITAGSETAFVLDGQLGAAF